MFDSPHLSNHLKIRLYIAAVISLMTYGCESWLLDQQCMKALNGANSKMLARITGETVQSQARSATARFDVVKNVRKRRLIWLGKLLRQSQQDRLIHDALKAQYAELASGIKGTLWMDTPPHDHLDELTMMATQKTYWNSLAEGIPSHLRQRSIYSEV